MLEESIKMNVEVSILSSDEKSTLSIMSILNSYMAERGVVFKVTTYNSLKFFLKNSDHGGILFIDDTFDGKDCIKIAEILRSRDYFEKMILLTSNQSLLYEGYKYEAFRMLQSPITTEDVFESIDAIYSSPLCAEKIMIKTGNKFIHISSEDIIYISAHGKTNLIVTKKGDIETTTPLFQLYDQLPNQFFFQCHKSYVVNFKLIRMISPKFETIQMVNLDIIPISRRKKSDFFAAREEFIVNYTKTI